MMCGINSVDGVGADPLNVSGSGMPGSGSAGQGQNVKRQDLKTGVGTTATALAHARNTGHYSRNYASI